MLKNLVYRRIFTHIQVLEGIPNFRQTPLFQSQRYLTLSSQFHKKAKASDAKSTPTTGKVDCPPPGKAVPPNKSSKSDDKSSKSGAKSPKSGDKGKDKSKAAEKGTKPKLKTFHIYRFTKESKKQPHMQKYTVDLNNCGPMILDALLKIKREQDSTLTFRRSCREGVCGSCAVNVDGKNYLSCTCNINPKGDSKIYPLPHMYVVKDLIVDFTRFLEQHRRAKPYLIRNSPEPLGQKQYLQSLKDRDKLDGYIECILCACCSTSCPEYWWHGHSKQGNDFLGPAALLQVDRWLRDSRDEASDCRLTELRNYFNVYRCHSIYNCTYCCPKRLNPAKAIAHLRMKLAGYIKKPKPEMTGLG